MRKFLLSLASALLVGQTAFAQPDLFLKTGATSVEVIGVGTTVSFSSVNFGGWGIAFIAGASNSPTTNPFGLDIISLTATCIGGPCAANPLDAWLTDTGFTTVNTRFDNTYAGALVGAGTARQIAWVGPGNIPFQSNGADGPPTVTGGPLISVVGPFTGPGVVGGSKIGGPAAGPGPYSLTIEDIFNANGQPAIFTTNGAVTGVPEPAAWAIFAIAIGSLACVRRRANRGITLH